MGSQQSSADDDGTITAVDCERKKLSIFERKKEFPSKLRIAIGEAANKRDAPEIFLLKIKNKLKDWIFEHATRSKDDTKGLNDERDSKKEVELAIRCFPEVLTERRYGLYPVLCLSKSIKSVSFIPLFVELGLEFGQFEDCERGGMIYCAGINVLSQLAATATNDSNKRNDKEDQHLVDEKFLAVIRYLREKNLMTKQDILRYNLIGILCKQTIFPEQRFRYFIGWDPSILTNKFENGSYRSLSLLCLIANFYDNIRAFRTVFELGLRHFSTNIGFMFHKNDANGAGAGAERTPFQIACKKYGNEEVKKILDIGLENQIIRLGETNHHHNFTRTSLIIAASEEIVDIECVFMLIRRDPAICQNQQCGGAATSMSVRKLPSSNHRQTTII